MVCLLGIVSSVAAFDIELSMLNFHGGLVDDEVNQDDIDDMSEHQVDSVLGEDQSAENIDTSAKKKHLRVASIGYNLVPITTTLHSTPLITQQIS